MKKNVVIIITTTTNNNKNVQCSICIDQRSNVALLYEIAMYKYAMQEMHRDFLVIQI